MRFIQACSLFTVIFASGCVASMEDAPFDAEVNVPEDLQIAWSVDNNDLDLSHTLRPPIDRRCDRTAYLDDLAK